METWHEKYPKEWDVVQRFKTAPKQLSSMGYLDDDGFGLVKGLVSPPKKYKV